MARTRKQHKDTREVRQKPIRFFRSSACYNGLVLAVCSSGHWILQLSLTQKDSQVSRNK